MKHSLRFLAVFVAASVPAAFAAELAGVALPTTVDPLHMFAAFVMTMVGCTVWADYARKAKSLTAVCSASSAARVKVAHPLAA